MADTEKPVLPPTPTRIRLAQDISYGHVKCWHFHKPEIRRRYDDRLVTAAIEELEYFELADRGQPEPPGQTSTVRLTPAGEEWLQTYGGNNP